jgi:hypothetical protein
MEKCTVELTKDNIISRSKTFDKHYVIVNNMLSQSGFGWDDDKNMISVEDDVWNNYAKVIITFSNKAAFESVYHFFMLEF